MNKLLLNIIILLTFFTMSLFASQKQTESIAQLSAVSLYNIDKNSVQKTIKAYLNNNPNVKALKIVETLSQETYISIYRTTRGDLKEGKLPEQSNYKVFKAEATYENEKVGEVLAYYENSKLVNLNAEEITWLKQNPAITIAVVKNYPPYDFKDEDGKLTGFHTDIKNLINKNLGINIKLKPFDSWSEAYDSTLKGNVNAIFSLSWNQEREEKYFIYTSAYHFSPYYLAIKKETEGINSLSDLSKKNIVVEKDTIFKDIAEEKISYANIIFAKDTKETFDLVNQEKALATIVSNIKDDLFKNSNLKVVSEIYHKSNNLHIGINKKYPIVASILAKGIDSISLKDITSLRQKWFTKTKATIDLNEEEKTWIDKNPYIKVIKFFDEPPFTLNTTEKSGYVYELVEYLIKSAGLQIKYIDGFTSYGDMLSSLEKGEVDILTTFPTSLDLSKDSNIKKSKSILKTPFVLISTTNIQDVTSIEDLFGKKVAVVKGYAQDKYLSAFEKIKKIYVNNNEAGFKALREGKAQYYINNKANSQYVLNKSFATDLKINYELPFNSFPPLSISFAMNGEKQTLVSILNKALEQVPYQKIKQIRDRWIIEDNETNNKIIFTNKEEEFLQKHPNIVLGADEKWHPFDFRDNFYRHAGFNAEYLKLLRKKLGINIKVELGPWDELQEKVKNKKLSGLVGPSKTDERDKYMVFTKPYFFVSQIILVRNNSNSLQSIKELEGKVLGVKKGSSNIELLKTKYPKIKQKLYETNGDIIRALSIGEIDAGISNIGAASYEMEQNLITNLKIGMKFGTLNDLRFGLRDDWPELASILQKGIDSITTEELEEILNKWLKLASHTTAKEKLNFTKEEKVWLDNNPVIKLAYMDYWPTDDNGKNIHTEYINLLSKYGNINITLVKYDSWKKGFDSAKRGDDIFGILNLSWSEEREKNSFYYTKPYFFEPAYLIIKSETTNIHTVEDISNKNIFTKEQAISNQMIKELKYNITPIQLKNEEDIHKALSQKNSQADALLTYVKDDELLEKYDLKVANKFFSKYGEIHIGVSKKQKELYSILNKIYTIIPKNELSIIQNKSYEKTKKIKVNLTKKEKEFIKKHKTIKVHNEKNWPPFNFYEFGQAKGYSIELMKLVAKNTGLNIEFITGPTWDQFLQMMQKDELDIMLNIVKSEEREKYLIFTDPFISAMHGIALHKDTTNISSFQDLIDKDKTISLERGFFYHEYLKKNFPNVKLNLVDNGIQTLLEVSSKRADATLGILPVMNYLAEKNYITNLKFFGDPQESFFKPIDLRFATRKSLPELKTILQKGLASITPEQKKELSKRWLVEEDSSKINLTNEEKLWLSNHKTIRFTADPNYLPYEEFDKNGNYNGMVSDYLKIIEETLDIKFEKIPTKNWSESLQKATDGEVDVLSNYTIDKSLEKIHKSTKPYIISPISIITKDDIPDGTTLEELKDKKIAIIKGYGYLDKILEKYPDLTYIEVNDADEGLKGVSQGSFDALICSMTLAHYKINDLGLYNLHIASQTSETMELGLGVRKDWDIFVNIVNKVIDSISHGKKQEIITKWLGDTFQPEQKIELNEKEKQWLEQNIPIKYVYDINWAPFEWKNELNEHTGIIFDILSLIEQRSGINFEEISTEKWSEAVEIMENNKADMYSGVGENEERKQYLNFTKNTIFETPYVFVAREDDKHDYLETFKVIQNKKVGVVDGYTIHGILKEFKPNLPLKTVKTVEEGFEKVRSGTIDIFIVNAATAKYFINRKGFEDLKIATKTEFNLELKIALQKNLPDEVLSILDKSIAAISEKEKSDIYFKWTEVLVEEKIDWDLIYKIGGGALLLIILVSYWNRRLKHAVDEKTHELQNILKSFDRNVIASKTDKKGVITYASKAFCKISGYTAEELIGNTHSMVRHGDTPRETFKDMWQTITKEKIWKGVLKNRTKDGSFYWVKVIISPEYDVKGNFTGYSAIREDITAQIEVENLSKNLENLVQERTKELNEQKLRFELTVAGSGDGLWEYDLEKNENWYSPRFKEMLGYKDEEFSNTMEAWQNSVHPEDIEYALSSFKEHIKKDIPFDITYRMKTKLGEYIWIRSRAKSLRDKSGWVTRTSGSIADITRLKEIQQEIEDKQKFLDTLLDSQEQIVITTDGFKLKSANKKFLDFFEIETIEDFTKDYDCICDRFENEEGYLSKIINDEKWIDFVINNKQTHKAKILKNGEERIFTVSAATMPIENGLIKSAVLTDITELENIRKNIEMILSNIMLPVLITARDERTILYANEYASIQYEAPIEELIGSSIDNVYTSDTQKDEILKHMQEKGYVENLEEKYKTNTGKEFTGLLSVKPITYNGIESFIGMVVDITKQKEIEEEIRQINKHTKDSIEYASLIQHALIPDQDKFNNYFKDYFTFWEPKDIVGGDIYLFEELRNKDECLLMVIDCTGHGVPGAFVTMLVKAIERQIVADINKSNDKVSTAKILSYFNVTMRKLLKQDHIDSVSNAGFDGGILYYNKKENIVRYSGALTTLHYIEDGELKKIKGDRESIGYKKSNPNFIFKEHDIDIKDGMKLYISTDGYIDQNGGERGFSMGKTKFTNIINENYQKPFAEQKEIFIEKLKEYQQNHIRNDDITIIGLELKKNSNLKDNKDINNWSI